MNNIVTICLISLATFHLNAQNINIEEPEFTGVILLIKDNERSEKLEKQKAYAGTKAKIGAAMFGVAKGKGINIVDGDSSAVRINAQKSIQFIIKVNDNNRDPIEVINIFQMERDQEKDKRILIVGTVNFNTTSTGDISFIPFEASKYGSNSYLVKVSDLPKGEYAITLDGSRDVFNLFGVD